MWKAKNAVLVGLLAALIVTACSDGEKQPAHAPAEVLLPDDQPVEHPIHSAELLVAMAGLEDLALGELPSALNPEQVDVERSGEVEKMAASIASSAAQLPDYLDSVALSAQDEAHFRDLAMQLERDADELRERAAADDLYGATEEREKLLATCNACHAQFRVMPSATEAE
jgi:hypothetical protein